MGSLAGRGMPSRLGRERSRFPKRVDAKGEAKARPWKHWYAKPAWKKLKRKLYKRDGGVCQATGVALVGKYPEPNSPVLDHKIPHRGDPKLFWDENNLWTVSKQWHDSVKQSEEKRGLHLPD